MFWTSNANAKMCTALEATMKDVRFRTDGTSNRDIFLVNEPEAQCVQALDNMLHRLQVSCDRLKIALMSIHGQPGEVVMLTDAGGGTADLTLFRLEHSIPVRLVSQIIRTEDRSKCQIWTMSILVLTITQVNALAQVT